jgi:UDP-glucuronate 4-epimerase
MAVLVTGGAGFIGSHVVEHLLAQGEDVVCVDNFDPFYDPALKRRNLASARQSSRFTLAEMSVTNPDALERLFAEHSIRAVVHLAARAGVRQSLREPLLYERVNVLGTLHLLELSRKHAVQRFVLASSSSVYGADCPVPFQENAAADRPISPYAATKRAAELHCHTYAHLYDLPITCLRLFTVYGPRQRPDLAIRRFTRAILAGQELSVYGDGSTSRDYTYVSDIVAGIVATLRLPASSRYEILNLGNSTPLALRDLIAIIESVVGRGAQLRYEPEQPGDAPRTYACIDRAKATLDWAPQVPIEAGIRAFVAWYQQESEAASRMCL